MDSTTPPSSAGTGNGSPRTEDPSTHDPSGKPVSGLEYASAALFGRSAAATDVALLLTRTMVGGVFVYHGSQKLFGAFGGPGVAGFAGYLETLGMPLPVLSAWMAAGTEFFGGLALLLGVLVRPAGLGLMVTMLVASFLAKDGFDARNGGMEYPLTLAVVTLSIALAGGGRFGIDGLVGRGLARRRTV